MVSAASLSPLPSGHAQQARSARSGSTPFVLRLYQGDICLLRHCHLRGTEKIFLAARIQDVTPLDETSQMPPGVDPEDLLGASLGIYPGEAYRAELRFLEEVACLAALYDGRPPG